MMNADDHNTLLACTGIQLLLVIVFYGFAYRHFFYHPGSQNPAAVASFGLLLLLFCGSGLLMTWLYGWWNVRRRHALFLMSSWSILLLLILFTSMSTPEELLKPTPGPILIHTALFVFYTIVAITIYLRQDEPFRKLIADPASSSAINNVCRIGARAIPRLRSLLLDEFAPLRLAAVECLSRLGPDARSVIEEAVHDEDFSVSQRASDILTEAHHV